MHGDRRAISLQQNTHICSNSSGVTLKKRCTVLSPTADSAGPWPTRYSRYFSNPSLFFRKHMATSSSVSHSFSFEKKTLHDKHPVKSSALKGFLHLRAVKTNTNSLVMEGFDIFNVPEDGFLLTADFRRCTRTVCMLQVMEGEEVDIF